MLPNIDHSHTEYIPYTTSLKLILDKWHDSKHYCDAEEIKKKSCFTTPPMNNKSHARFSYETNSDRLLTTNIRGRCQPFLAPKTLSFNCTSYHKYYIQTIDSPCRTMTRRELLLDLEDEDEKQSLIGDIIIKLNFVVK